MSKWLETGSSDKAGVSWEVPQREYKTPAGHSAITHRNTLNMMTQIAYALLAFNLSILLTGECMRTDELQ